MNRHPHEQNLPDGVTNKDIEEHFGYAEPEICNACHEEVDSLTRDGRCRECYLAEEGPQD